MFVAACAVASVMIASGGPARDASAADTPPTLDELREATYAGLAGVPHPVTLAGGSWEDPQAPVGVSLAPDFVVHGDLDGRVPDDAVVVLAETRGGTGTVSYFAVVARRDGKLVNLATARIGDRVQLRDVRIDNRRLVADVVQAGADDPMCCPAELATRTWELRGERLRELPRTGPTARLSLAALGDEPWVLRAWTVSERAPAVPKVTLQWK